MKIGLQKVPFSLLEYDDKMDLGINAPFDNVAS